MLVQTNEYGEESPVFAFFNKDLVNLLKSFGYSGVFAELINECEGR